MADRARATCRRASVFLIPWLAFVLQIAPPLNGQMRDTPNPDQDQQILHFGIGMDPLEPTRRQLEVMLSDRILRRRYSLTTSARFGRYSPHHLVGDSRATLDGFADNVRRDFWSLYMGLTGQAPILPTAWGLYARVAAGGSAYMGQQFRDAPPGGDPSQIQPKVSLRLAPGVEIAVGRAWLEILGDIGLKAEWRLGYEQVSRSDRQGPNSMLLFGGVIPF
jgi:hypothetical protein